MNGGEWVSSVNEPTGWYDKATFGWYPMLEEVYRDGRLVKETTFEEVRANSMK
jgi:hypothetical protein